MIIESNISTILNLDLFKKRRYVDKNPNLKNIFFKKSISLSLSKCQEDATTICFSMITIRAGKLELSTFF